MIEYVSKPGGRHLYNEDMINLQNLVLAFTEFFKNCGDWFVISGCNKYDENGVYHISEGYVWFAGKVRYLPDTIITEEIRLSCYMVANDYLSDPIIYATSGITGPINKSYEAKLVGSADGYEYSELLWTANSDELRYHRFPCFFSKYSLVKKGFWVEHNSLSKPVDFLNLEVDSGSAEKIKIVKISGSPSTSTTQPSAGAKPYYTSTYRAYRTYNSGTFSIVDAGFVNFSSQILFSNLSLYFWDSLSFKAISIGENLPNTTIQLPTVNTKDMVSSIVNAMSLSINGTSINIILRPKTPLTGWLHLSGTDNLVVKQVYNDVFITGRLPFADESVIITNVSTVNNNCIKKQTNVKLPDSISLPPENTVFNVRGGNHCYYNGSADLYFDSDGYLCIEMDSREKFVPNPSSVCWHYIAD